MTTIVNALACPSCGQPRCGQPRNAASFTCDRSTCVEENRAIVKLAIVANTAGLTALAATCKAALGRKPGDADPAARDTIRAIIVARAAIPEAHKARIREIIGPEPSDPWRPGGDRLVGALAYLVGYMVDHSDDACETKHASGFITSALDVFAGDVPGSPAQRARQAAYDLEIFDLMRVEAARRRALEAS